MGRFFLIVFSLLIAFTQAMGNAGFQLRINQWGNPKSIAIEQLTFQEGNVVEEKIEKLSLKTKSGITVPVTFYDRNSDGIIIVAQALPAPKSSMNIFTRICANYDVVLFDYRWCGQYESFLAKSILAGEPIKRVLLDEMEELEAVVDFTLKKKSYNFVAGLGQCYGCFHLAKLQSDSIRKNGSGPFTHLILDSCWYSLRHFAERICYDPFLPISPQDGGAPEVIKWVTDNGLFKSIVLGSVFKLMSDVSVEPYISTVGIPVLFIHGLNDLFVPQKHFQKIWQSTDKENRTVLLTPFRHLDNLGNKEVYRSIVETFVSSETTQEFEKKVSGVF